MNLAHVSGSSSAAPQPVDPPPEKAVPLCFVTWAGRSPPHTTEACTRSVVRVTRCRGVEVASCVCVAGDRPSNQHEDARSRSRRLSTATTTTGMKRRAGLVLRFLGPWRPTSAGVCGLLATTCRATELKRVGFAFWSAFPKTTQPVEKVPGAPNWTTAMVRQPSYGAPLRVSQAWMLVVESVRTR
jgi:hypothetical protein